MGDKIGGFGTTGIWVLLKYGVPLAAFVGAAAYFATSDTRAQATLEATVGRLINLSAVPGFETRGEGTIPGFAEVPPPPPEGGYLFNTFGIGKPIVTEETPRVRLADLPKSTQPQVLRLADLPSPSESSVYRVSARKRPAETAPSAPGLTRSPRPHALPVDLGSLPPFQPKPPTVIDQAASFLSRLGVPVAP